MYIEKYWYNYIGGARACLKIHSRHLHAPLCGIFGPNSLNVAHYAAFILGQISHEVERTATRKQFSDTL